MKRYYYLEIFVPSYNHRYARRYADTPNALVDCLRFVFRQKEKYPDTVCKLASRCVQSNL